MTQAGPFASPPPARNAARTKPFLKWAGGKTQLLPDIIRLLPCALTGSDAPLEGCYFEPFMGSAALYFHLSPQLTTGQAFLGDMNEELVLTFLAVRDHLEPLLDQLSEHDRAHNGAPDFGAQSAYYYQVRALDRDPDWHADAFTDPAKTVRHAARFIYLNRTCFNGLWRVNSKGHHNVPMGRYKNPGIYNPRFLEQAHLALQGVEVRHQAFEVTAARAQAGDVVYFDPPYMPLSVTSSFNAYAKDAFLGPAHQKLAVVLLALAARGVEVVGSNSDTPFTRAPLGVPGGDPDAFTALVRPILEALEPLYSGVAVAELYETYRARWQVETVYASRAINAKGAGRGAISEILVYTSACSHV